MAMIHEFDPQIYPRLLWVMIGGSEKDIIAQFKNCDGTEFNLSDFNKANCAFCIHARQKSTGLIGEFIWITERKYARGSTMTHEAAHAAMDICYDLGIEIDPLNQEPFAYLVGWIMKEINIAYRFKESK